MATNENQIVVYQSNETVRLDVLVGMLAKRGRGVNNGLIEYSECREVA